MTDDEKKRLKKIIVGTGTVYGKEYTDGALLMIVDDLSDLAFDDVSEAYRKCRMDHMRRFAPLPAEIRHIVNPQENDEDEARDSAARIVAAVSRFGWANQLPAREFIGELGWMVVERQGGWATICGELTDQNIGMLQAQFRELAGSLRRRAKIGLLHVPPRIAPQDTQGLVSLADVVSKALEKKT